jgi:hypothetical protein
MCRPVRGSPPCRELNQFLNLLNNDGMSPLTLAAHLGHKKMFSHILERSKIVHWTWGPVSCSLYPLEGLDFPPEPNFATGGCTATTAATIPR